MTKCKNILAAVVLIVSAALFNVNAANYSIMVNAGTKTGSWNRFYERGVGSDHMHTVLSTAYERGSKNALTIAHDSAGFQYVRGHGILDDDVAVYSEDGQGNAVYSWTNLDRVYDSIMAAGMRPFVEISFMPNALASAQTFVNNVWYNGYDPNWNAPKDWNKWKAFMSAFITHLETRYGVAEIRKNWFFEVWNEPNWMYGGGGGDNGYLRLYDSTAVAIKATDSLVSLGGPAENGGASQSFIPTLIQHCKTGNKKLDFVTYHCYANDGAGTCIATVSSSYHQEIVTAVKNNNFTGKILCSEMGPTYTQGSQCLDNEQGASYIAKAIHLINSNDTLAYPPPYVFSWWAVSDLYEETNNTSASPAFSGCYGLMCRGVPGITQSYDIRKPSFNAYMLLHRLNGIKISCTGGTTASPGVNAVATISATNDTVSVLIYSHVDGTTGNNATSDAVTLNISGIPTTAGNTTATMKHWVVDATHSNSYRTWVNAGSPANPKAAQWTTIAAGAQLGYYDTPGTVTLGGTTGSATYSKTITQYYYSVSMIQLTNFRTVTGAIGQSKTPMVFNSVVKVKMTGKNMLVDFPSKGEYCVQLYAPNGQKIRDFGSVSSGKAVYVLDNIARGTYMLDCTGKSGSWVTPVFVDK